MLRWDWSQKIGSVKRTDRNGLVYYTELYQGNALLIEIYVSPDDKTYQLMHFWCDDKHAKNCIRDNLKSFEGARVMLLNKEVCKKDLKNLTQYLLLSGASVEYLQ